jgi:hypothetical protein
MKIFRIDDIGASTKQFEQHGRWKIGNFWFLKRMRPFKGWGPYSELNVLEWERILEVFEQKNIKPIIAITAAWVEKNGSLTSFPQKFPEEASILKQTFLGDKLEIANHGLTHCVIGKHLPRFWSSNRKFHREFWPELSQETHTEHILKSQEILENFFNKPISIFVPPGNIWSEKTYLALRGTNIKKIISNQYMRDRDKPMEGIEFIDDKQGYFCFHDKELKEKGLKWLKNKLN